MILTAQTYIMRHPQLATDHPADGQNIKKELFLIFDGPRGHGMPPGGLLRYYLYYVASPVVTSI